MLIQRFAILFEPQSDISVICPLALVAVLALVCFESKSESNAISCSIYTTWYANHIVAITVFLLLFLLVILHHVTGYTAPCNFAGYPTTSRTSYIDIIEPIEFWYISWFSTGNDGKDQTVNYSILHTG